MNIIQTKAVQEFSCLRYAGTRRSLNEVLKFVTPYLMANFNENGNSLIIEFSDYSVSLKKGDWICKQKFNGKEINKNYFSLTNAEFREKFLPILH